MSMENYYDKQKYPRQAMPSIEKATLAEDLTLPSITKDSLTLGYLEGGGEYELMQNKYKDLKGKFFISILSPLVDQEEAESVGTAAPSTLRHTGNGIQTQGFKTSNYATLKIPKYIAMNFDGKIPKGTEFLVASIGGTNDISDMKIIGVI